MFLTLIFQAALTMDIKISIPQWYLILTKCDQDNVEEENHFLVTMQAPPVGTFTSYAKFQNLIGLVIQIAYCRITNIFLFVELILHRRFGI
jgi:hypothetical protein